MEPVPKRYFCSRCPRCQHLNCNAPRPTCRGTPRGGARTQHEQIVNAFAAAANAPRHRLFNDSIT
eukprot:2144439-Lingulodinium_polyedra.AAC.1